MFIYVYRYLYNFNFDIEIFYHLSNIIVVKLEILFSNQSK